MCSNQLGSWLQSYSYLPFCSGPTARRIDTRRRAVLGKPDTSERASRASTPGCHRQTTPAAIRAVEAPSGPCPRGSYGCGRCDPARRRWRRAARCQLRSCSARRDIEERRLDGTAKSPKRHRWPTFRSRGKPRCSISAVTRSSAREAAVSVAPEPVSSEKRASKRGSKVLALVVLPSVKRRTR